MELGFPREEPTVVHDAPHQTPSARTACPAPQGDEGENEVGEENADRLDCHIQVPTLDRRLLSPHTRPRSTIRLLHSARSAFILYFWKSAVWQRLHTFDRRWDGMRCALTAMMDRHVTRRCGSEYVGPWPIPVLRRAGEVILSQGLRMRKFSAEKKLRRNRSPAHAAILPTAFH
ncbi:unnamed protein product [Gadus morhua 'NCC']